MSGNIDITGQNPYISLIGTESSNDPVGIREKAGNIEIYDVSTDTAQLTMDVSTGDVILAGGLTVTTAKTDGQVAIPVGPGLSISGTWTLTDASNVITATRTAATATHYYVVPIGIPFRTTTSKGAKLTSISASYTVSGGASSDVIQFLITKQTLPADASGAVGAVLAGDSDSDYDTNHNTDAKRYATASHTLTVTIPTGEQAFMATGEQLYLKIKITDAASADLAFAFTGAVANFTIATM